MTDADFLLEIKAAPDDDMPRQIYADWLEERGDPRAEFIRTQCELETAPWYAQRLPALRDREQLLLKHHQKSWLEAIPRLLTRHVRFRRGFVGEFRDHYDRVEPLPELLAPLLAVAPLLDTLSLRSLRDERPFAFLLREVTQTAGFEQIQNVEASNIGPDDLSSLGFSGASLRRLSLDRIQPGDSSGIRVLQAGAGKRLTHLKIGLPNNSLGDINLWARFPELRSLSVVSAAQRFSFGTAPFAVPPPPNLAALDLSGWSTLDSDLQQLCSGGWLRRIKSLSLRNGQISDAGLDRLLSAAGLEGLLELDLSGNPIGDEGLLKLIRSSRLTSLRFLNLADTHVGGAGLEALAESQLWVRLRAFRCGNPGLSDNDVRPLVDSPEAEGKEHFNLSGCTLSYDLEGELSHWNNRGPSRPPWITSPW